VSCQRVTSVDRQLVLLRSTSIARTIPPSGNDESSLFALSVSDRQRSHRTRTCEGCRARENSRAGNERVKGDILLKLRKVEITGFKSFSERTVVTFSGTGTTCIVGPNGCGKSNVVDAISWVLGEQSHKSLRAGRMSDCIFNGTVKRPPMGTRVVGARKRIYTTNILNAAGPERRAACRRLNRRQAGPTLPNWAKT